MAALKIKGLVPEEGINALTVASDAIMNMKLSRIDSETTANIGIVSGGQATNIVMPELYLNFNLNVIPSYLN